MDRMRNTKIAVLPIIIILLALIFGAMTLVGVRRDVADAAQTYSQSIFEIKSSGDFAELAALSAANSENDFTGKTVSLLADVDVPLGASFNSFNGTFRGNGFALRGVKTALFNRILNHGVVRDLTVFSDGAAGVLAKGSNLGTITNVDVYGTSTAAIVNNNGGTLSNVSVFADVSGAEAYLTEVNSGTLDSCFLSGSFTPKRSTLGIFTKAALNDSVVSNSAFNGRIAGDGPYTVEPFGKIYRTGNIDETVGVETVNSVSVTIVSEATVAFSSDYTDIEPFSVLLTADGTSFTVFDEAGDEGTDVADLGGEFFVANGMTVNKTLFGTSGEYGNEFVLRSVTDVKKLVFAASGSGETGFYAKLGKDIFGCNHISGAGTPAYGTVKGEVDGNGFIFAQTEFNPFPSGVNAAVSVESGFGGDGYESGSLTAAVGETEEVTGEGTQASPYLITSLSELVGVLSDEDMNSAGKYAVVNRNILVNTTASHNKILTGLNVSLTLDFLGHGLINNYSAPFVNVEGALKNLDVELHARSSIRYGICEWLTGRLDRVKLTGYGTAENGLCVTNDGVITLCHNGLQADNAFCSGGTGTAENCTSVVCDGFAGGSVTVKYCVMPGRAVADGVALSSSDYFTLSGNGFDTVGVFGYPVGESEAIPQLRSPNGNYRTLASKSVILYDPIKNGFGNLEYNPDGEPVADIEETAVTDVDLPGLTMSFTWTYNGDEFTGSSLIDSGDYVMTVHFSGDRYITESVSMSRITVAKADFEEGMRADDFVNASFTYTGEEITDEPMPVNAEALMDAGYSFIFRTTKNSEDCPILNAGKYVQTLTATSNNYKTLTVTRTVTVGRATLYVTVVNQSTVYGEEFSIANLDETALTASPIGQDAGKSVKTLIEESGGTYLTCFGLTGYTAASDVGMYPLSFTAAPADNYTFSVTQGELEVCKATMSGIVFSDDSFTYDGNPKNLVLTGAPNGAEISYEGNGRVNVGHNTVRATVTHKNYNMLEKEAELTVNKAELTLTVTPFTEKYYGYTFNPEDFSFETDGLAEADELEAVTENVELAFAVADGTEALVVSDYYVTLTVTGEAENYYFTVTDGVLRILKASLTAVFPRESFGKIEKVYDGKEADYAFPEDAFGDVSVSVGDYVIEKGGQTVTSVTDVGTYTVRVLVTPADGDAPNYEATEYSRTVEIKTVKVNVSFGENEYEFTFDGSNFAEYDFEYNAENIDKSQIAIKFLNALGGETGEIIHAGRYTAVAEFYGNGNYSYAKKEVPVIVKPREIMLEMKESYEYSASPVRPQITVSYAGGFKGNLRDADFSYSYLYENGITADRAVEKGDYGVKVTCLNSDYKLSEPDFSIRITPLAVTVSVADFSFLYGTSGTCTPDGLDGDTATVFENSVTLNNRYIAETDEHISLTFRLLAADIASPYFPMGDYRVTDGLIIQPKNYTVRFSEAFTVSVTKRILQVTWYLGKDEVRNGQSGVSLTYAGADVSNKITHKIEGIAERDNPSEIKVTPRVTTANGTDAQLRNAGSYKITLYLSGSANYGLSDGEASLSVEITKAPLVSITVGDVEVRQRENLPMPPITIGGLMGDDVNKTPSELRGFSFSVITDYNPMTASIGENKYYVSGTFSFGDYTVDQRFVRSGRVKVVEGYPTYTLPSKTFEYDGTEKKIEITNLAEGISVDYMGTNVQTEVGKYTVVAVVTYPSGRKSATLSSVLEITKAEPRIRCENEYGIFTKELVFDEASLNASAYLNDVIPSVSGRFTMARNVTLVKGVNSINATFIPDDTKNLKQVTFTKTVTLYEIGSNALDFSHNDYIYDGEGSLRLNKPLEIRLLRSDFPGLGDDLAMFLNGLPATVAVLERTATETVEIRYGGASVYVLTLKVVYGDGNGEEKDEVTVDHTMLVCTDLQFSNDGDRIYVKGTSGTIRLDDKYKADYLLVVNGDVVGDSYTVNADVQKISISIRNKKIGVSLYYKSVTVSNKTPEPMDGDGAGVSDGENWLKTHYYYIIIAVVGAAAVAAVLLIIIKSRK